MNEAIIPSDSRTVVKAMPGMSERLRIVLLMALAILVYGNALFNGFTFDDQVYILHNPTVTSHSIKGLFEPNKANNVLRPVTFATLALDWAMAGPRPFTYHLFNLLLHAAVTLLLYLALRMLLESEPSGTTIAFVSALLFAVHPIHTEAVASIVGCSELLATGFLLAAWFLHLQDRQLPALACLLLAMMSKESAVVLLPLVLISDYARGKFKPFLRYASMAGVIALYLAVFWKLKGDRFGEVGVAFVDNPLASFPAKLRILNAVRIAWKYVGLLVCPAHLSSDYSYNAILLYANLRHTLPGVIAAVCVVGLWLWAAATKRIAWALAGTIYLGGFAVTANLLVPTGTIMGERLAYLPSAGFCLLVALFWIRLEKRHQRLAWAVLALIVAAFATRTVARNRDWRNNFTLFSADVQTVPGSAKIHTNAAAEYLRLGQLDAAHREIQTALRIFRDFPEAIEISGLVEFRMGHEQESRKLLEKALSMTQKDNIDYDFRAVNLAAVLVQLGEFDEALKLLDQEILESRADARAWSNRSVVRLKRGHRDLARADAEMALRLEPSNAQAQNLLRALNGAGPLAPSR